MDIVIIVVLLLLLLGTGGPRLGWYGTRSTLWDLLSLLVVIILVVWLLRLAGVVHADELYYAQVGPGGVTVPAGVPNIILWSEIVGFILPAILSVIMQPSWTDQTRAWVAFLVCLPVAAVTVYLNNALNVADLVTSFLLILVTTIATYAKFWKTTGIAPKIEKLTSRVPSGATTPHELHS